MIAASRWIPSIFAVVSAAGFSLGSSPALAQAIWNPVGSLAEPRLEHTTTLLPSGNVLVTGGTGCPSGLGSKATAELYDPATRTWSPVAAMSHGREGHTATLLGNGKVLVVGGMRFPVAIADTAELYDPATNSWTSVPGLSTARWYHTATLLSDGKVLVAGGTSNGSSVPTLTEIYDPVTNTWASTTPMNAGRKFHTSTRLQDGRVLVAGGWDLNGQSTRSVDIYDPTTNAWSVGPPMLTRRYFHHAQRLGDGRLMVIGGFDSNAAVRTLASTEIYDPVTNGWSAGALMKTPRYQFISTALADGDILVAGGTAIDVYIDTDKAEIYDLASGAWSDAAPMTTSRTVFFANGAPLMPDGSVLVPGGNTRGNCLRNAELYETPFTPPAANAGPDQTVPEGTEVHLDGTGSTGQGLTYSWTQVAGEPVTLTGDLTATPSFVPQLSGGLVNQTLTFQLTVAAGGHASADTVNIAVINNNHAPIALAGEDQTVNEGGAVLLSALASYDPDADPIVSYSWEQVDGPMVSIDNAGTAEASFTAPELGGGIGSAGSLTFRLTVFDGALSGTDEITVTVEQVNHAPLADAGADQTRNEQTLVTLQGSGSRDPDGDGLTYSWTQVGGVLVTLSDDRAANPGFQAPAVGPGGETLEFELLVADGALSTADRVRVSILNVNDPPACALARSQPSLLWPPNHKLVDVAVAGVTDPQDETVVITVTGVTQDEPLSGTGDGDTAPDAIRSGHALLLRAERSGHGNGRVYRITFEADDGQGGACTGAVTVAVPHSKKSEAAIDDGQAYDSTRP
jgi:hypothetical protein